MNTQDDVEAMLSAVRRLVSSKPEADRLVLTDAQRVLPVQDPEPAEEGDGFRLPCGDVELRKFARLTALAPGEDVSTRARAGDAPAPDPSEKPFAAELSNDLASPDLPASDLSGDPISPDVIEAASPPAGGERYPQAETLSARMHDADALREIVRNVLREEVRTRMGRRINENIRRIVREELDRRLGPPAG